MKNHRSIQTEIEERGYLKWVCDSIRKEMYRMEAVVREQSGNVNELKTYLSESKADMDHVEKVGVRQSVYEMALMGEHSAREWLRLGKLLNAPYFGRIDFRRSKNKDVQQVYIGIHSFHQPNHADYLVHDWRSPIASMFYDYELGHARYEAPSGTLDGEISRKRQYRIQKGELEFFIESALSIRDEILQKELSRPGNDKMKQIVATIQRDQNAIIRNTGSHTLIIQGAAGSGKTSIALHRIAFLLYQQKETLNSSDILIISPNKVFADYISNVLPELGEENMRETTIEDLAATLIPQGQKFESFYEQLAELLAKPNPILEARIRYKSSREFMDQFDDYVLMLRENNLKPAPVKAGMATFEDDWIAACFSRNELSPFAERINDVLSQIADEFERRYDRPLRKDERDAARKQLTAMFGNTKLLNLYKGFFEWIHRPDLFKLRKGNTLEHADVFPVIYLRQHLERMEYRENIKHLVIDEMQDYTPIHYHVLMELFACRKTILGDANQSVNPLSASTAEGIREIVPGADCVYMNKSYRSTKEITDFAQRIQCNEQLIPIERHGDPVKCLSFPDENSQKDWIRRSIASYRERGYQSIAVLCKTQDEASDLAAALSVLDEAVHLLDEQSSAFSQGIIISTSYLAKGLEFDEVIVPHCTSKQYQSEMERHLLYVACTRAMHKLTLTYQGELPSWVA